MRLLACSLLLALSLQGGMAWTNDKTTTSKCSSRPPNVDCDKGEHREGKCVIRKTKPAELTCKTGFNLKGDKCVKKVTIDKEAKCPDDSYELVGDVCKKKDIREKEWYCEQGWELDEHTHKCYKEKRIPANKDKKFTWEECDAERVCDNANGWFKDEHDDTMCTKKQDFPKEWSVDGTEPCPVESYCEKPYVYMKEGKYAGKCVWLEPVGPEWKEETVKKSCEMELRCPDKSVKFPPGAKEDFKCIVEVEPTYKEKTVQVPCDEKPKGVCPQGYKDVGFPKQCAKTTTSSKKRRQIPDRERGGDDSSCEPKPSCPEKDCKLDLANNKCTKGPRGMISLDIQWDCPSHCERKDKGRNLTGGGKPQCVKRGGGGSGGGSKEEWACDDGFECKDDKRDTPCTKTEYTDYINITCPGKCYKKGGDDKPNRIRQQLGRGDDKNDSKLMCVQDKKIKDWTCDDDCDNDNKDEYAAKMPNKNRGSDKPRCFKKVEPEMKCPADCKSDSNNQSRGGDRWNNGDDSKCYKLEKKRVPYCPKDCEDAKAFGMSADGVQTDSYGDSDRHNHGDDDLKCVRVRTNLKEPKQKCANDKCTGKQTSNGLVCTKKKFVPVCPNPGQGWECEENDRVVRKLQDWEQKGDVSAMGMGKSSKNHDEDGLGKCPGFCTCTKTQKAEEKCPDRDPEHGCVQNPSEKQGVCRKKVWTDSYKCPQGEGWSGPDSDNMCTKREEKDAKWRCPKDCTVEKRGGGKGRAGADGFGHDEDMCVVVITVPAKWECPTDCEEDRSSGYSSKGGKGGKCVRLEFDEPEKGCKGEGWEYDEKRDVCVKYEHAGCEPRYKCNRDETLGKDNMCKKCGK